MRVAPFKGLIRVVCGLAVVAATATAQTPAPAAPPATDAQTARMVADLGLREGETPVSSTPGWKRPSRVLVRDLPADRRAWLQEVAPGVKLRSNVILVCTPAEPVVAFAAETCALSSQASVPAKGRLVS